ncbi:unnamed protein product [Agarophyton chilense]
MYACRCSLRCATNNIVASLVSSLFAVRHQPLPNEHPSARIASIIGATTAAEIGLANIALNLLSVSFSTVLKATAPFFVLAWGIVLGVHKLRFGVAASLFAMAAGLILAVCAEHKNTAPALSHFLRLGLLAQLVSALFSGFRWVLTQVFIKRDPLLNQTIPNLFNYPPASKGWSAIETVRYVSPFTLLWILPFVLLVEGASLFNWIHTASFPENLKLLVVLSSIGSSVFVLLWSEYELVRITSSLTVSVTFVFKEMLLIFAAALIFSDRLSWLTCAGFAIVQAGVVCYVSQKNRHCGNTKKATQLTLGHESP